MHLLPANFDARINFSNTNSAAAAKAHNNELAAEKGEEELKTQVAEISLTEL